MTNNEETRRFSRAPFDGTAQLQVDDHLVPVELQDISIRGAQIRLLEPVTLHQGTECRLCLQLDDTSIRLSLQSQVRHMQDDTAGLIFTLIDVTEMQHLRRIVEVNLGDQGDIRDLLGQ